MRRRLRCRNERGYALLAAILVIFLLSIALALLGASLQIRMRLVREEGKTVILGALSDAAVAEALANLAESASYSGSSEHELGGGCISSQVQPLGAGIYKLEAAAKLGNRKRVIQAEVLRGPGMARVRSWRRLPDWELKTDTGAGNGPHPCERLRPASRAWE